MKTMHSPPRTLPHSPEEVAGFNEVLDREALEVKASLVSVVGTLGVPATWSRALGVAVPVAAHAAAGVVKALHPESPGGPKLTKEELLEIANKAGAELKAGILRQFGKDITS